MLYAVMPTRYACGRHL